MVEVKNQQTQNAGSIDKELMGQMAATAKGSPLYVATRLVLANMDKDLGGTMFVRAYPLSPQMRQEDGSIGLYKESNVDDPKGLGAMNLYFYLDPTTSSGLPAYVPDPNTQGLASKDIFVFLQKRAIAGLYNVMPRNSVWQTTLSYALDCVAKDENLKFFQNFVKFLIQIQQLTDKDFKADSLPDLDNVEEWVSALTGLHPDFNRNKGLLAIYNLALKLSKGWDESIHELQNKLTKDYDSSHIENVFMNWLSNNYEQPICVPQTSAKVPNRDTARKMATRGRELRDNGVIRKTLSDQLDSGVDPSQIDVSALVLGGNQNTSKNDIERNASPARPKISIETVPVSSNSLPGAGADAPSNAPAFSTQDDDGEELFSR